MSNREKLAIDGHRVIQRRPDEVDNLSVGEQRHNERNMKKVIRIFIDPYGLSIAAMQCARFGVELLPTTHLFGGQPLNSLGVPANRFLK